MRQIIRVLVTVKYTEAFTRWLWMSKSDLPTDAAQLAECRGYHFTLQPVWMIQRCRQTDPSQRQKQKHKHLRITSLFLPSTIKQLPSAKIWEDVSKFRRTHQQPNLFHVFCLAPHSSRTPSPPHRASHGTNAGAVERQRPCRRPRPCRASDPRGKSRANSQPNIKITSRI